MEIHRCNNPEPDDLHVRYRRPTLAEAVEKAGHCYPNETPPEAAQLQPRKVETKDPFGKPKNYCPAIPLGDRRCYHKLGD